MIELNKKDLDEFLDKAYTSMDDGIMHLGEDRNYQAIQQLKQLLQEKPTIDEEYIKRKIAELDKLFWLDSDRESENFVRQIIREVLGRRK